jgi:hypothetical protein
VHPAEEDPSVVSGSGLLDSELGSETEPVVSGPFGPELDSDEVALVELPSVEVSSAGDVSSVAPSVLDPSSTREKSPAQARMGATRVRRGLLRLMRGLRSSTRIYEVRRVARWARFVPEELVLHEHFFRGGVEEGGVVKGE